MLEKRVREGNVREFPKLMVQRIILALQKKCQGLKEVKQGSTTSDQKKGSFRDL